MSHDRHFDREQIAEARKVYEDSHMERDRKRLFAMIRQSIYFNLRRLRRKDADLTQQKEKESGHDMD